MDYFKRRFLCSILKLKSSPSIRPYEHYDFAKLLRMKSFFFLCKQNVIISNMKRIYNTFSQVLGRNFVNKFVEVMYCDLLTGGSSFNDLEQTIKNLEKEGVISIIDYCREFLTKEEEKVNYLFLL